MIVTKELIAFIPGPLPHALEATLPTVLSAYSVANWTVIMARSSLSKSFGRGRIIKHAHTRQTWLEALMPAGTVIPAMPGTRLAPTALKSMMMCNMPLLDKLHAQLAGRVQYQITLRCDLDAAVQILGSACGPFQGMVSGTTLHSALNAHVQARLAAIPDIDVMELPVAGDMIVNCAVLLPQEKNFALDQAMEDIDALWSSGFALRQIGPSPAVSFASVGLKYVPLKILKDAATTLGVPMDAPPDLIREARQTALRQLGVKTEQIREAAALLTMVSTMVGAPTAFHRAFAWSEGAAATAQARAA
jgi:hypothetical protein